MTDRSKSDHGEDSDSPTKDRSSEGLSVEKNAEESAKIEKIEIIADPDIDEEREAALALLAQLRVEHRRIDQEIHALVENGVTDILKISRMKKIKLSIKDQIAYLENHTTPDIIA